MNRPPRPRLSGRILVFAVIDVAGMVLFASGALWLVRGQALFIPDYPQSTFSAVVALVGGLALMVWAAARILREIVAQAAARDAEGR